MVDSGDNATCAPGTCAWQSIPREKPRFKAILILFASAVWLAVLGWVDRTTGYELDLFAFYTAPVGMVAWSSGQGLGIVVAFIASIIWYMADRFAGDRYSSQFYAYWNTGMHFSSFIINAVTVAKIKSNLDRRHDAERALHAAQAQLKQALSEPCPHCGHEESETPHSKALTASATPSKPSSVSDPGYAPEPEHSPVSLSSVGT